MRSSGLVCAALLSVGTSLSCISTPVPPRQKSSADVQEAVIRYLMDHEERASASVFLSLDGNEPPPSFMRRFVLEFPRVLPASLASEGQYGQPVDTIHGYAGSRVLISAVTFIDATHAQAGAGIRCGRTCGVGYHFTLLLSEGKWSVTSVEETWVS